MSLDSIPNDFDCFCKQVLWLLGCVTWYCCCHALCHGACGDGSCDPPPTSPHTSHTRSHTLHTFHPCRSLWELGSYSQFAVNTRTSGLNFAKLRDPANGTIVAWIILLIEWPVFMLLAYYLEQVFGLGGVGWGECVWRCGTCVYGRRLVEQAWQGWGLGRARTVEVV